MSALSCRLPSERFSLSTSEIGDPCRARIDKKDDQIMAFDYSNNNNAVDLKHHKTKQNDYLMWGGIRL